MADERFDVVLFNPPYFRGEPRDLSDHAWRSATSSMRSYVCTERGARRLYQRSGYHLVYLSPDRGGEVVRRRRAGEGASA